MDLSHLGPMWSLVSRRAQCSGHYFSYFISMTLLTTFNPIFVCLQTIASCTGYRTIRSQDDSCKLQNDISSLLRWAETWQMKFNSNKCHILFISHQRNKSSPVYYLGTDVLSTVSSHTYLGITVSPDLKWREHISNVCLKATRTLNSQPPMKINLCHCQFVLMLLNIHFFLGPLPIGIPFYLPLAVDSVFPWRSAKLGILLSLLIIMTLCW